MAAPLKMQIAGFWEGGREACCALQRCTGALRQKPKSLTGPQSQMVLPRLATSKPHTSSKSGTPTPTTLCLHSRCKASLGFFASLHDFQFAKCL